MDDAQRLSIDVWDAGLPLEQYLEQMQTLQQAMRRRIAWIRLTPFERNVFSALQGSLKVMVVTADDSLDSLMNLPVLAQITFHAPQLDMRIFPRAQFPRVACHFEERGLAGLPVFAFFDESFKEIGAWNQRPALAKQKLEQWLGQQPADPSAQPLREVMEDWYDQGLQCETTTEIRSLLSDYLPE